MGTVIGAVVVTYSAPAATVAACLRSLRDAGGAEALLLVDTGGHAVLPDDLVPTVELMAVPNRGYGAAANAGWRHLRELGVDTVAVLNDDVVVRPGWLDRLGDVLRGPVGVVQPVLVTPGPGAAAVASLGVEFDRFGAGLDLGHGEAAPAPGATVPLEVFTGGAFVATMEYLVDMGGFDERWFLYYEDADLASRARERGWEHRLVTGSVVEHVGGVSTTVDTDRTRYLQERNRLWFAARHLPLTTIVRALWLSVRRLRHAPRRVHARALTAGLAGMPARALERRRSRRAISGGGAGRSVTTRREAVG